jgi:hypothetical protein
MLSLGPVEVSIPGGTLGDPESPDSSRIRLFRGDSYTGARAISYTTTSDLADRAIKLVATLVADSRIGFTVVGSVTGDHAGKFELPPAITSTLYVGDDAYEFEVVIVDGDAETTDSTGTITVTGE